ncbi:hypothetical protein MFIFM68171_04471 [Madurella fahalii]|uniref:Uncharacterized protein n=1 Tax=Madurella fahalii TaxID=1157608 RepID=A0ABQ0G949_9PEZI
MQTTPFATLPVPIRTITMGCILGGKDIAAGTKEFDALYAKVNNQYMYHLLYSDKLVPYMAMLQIVLEAGIDAAMQNENGKHLMAPFQGILDDAMRGSADPIFVRLGATSAKDSFAKSAPITKPGPWTPMPT